MCHRRKTTCQALHLGIFPTLSSYSTENLQERLHLSSFQMGCARDSGRLCNLLTITELVLSRGGGIEIRAMNVQLCVEAS